MVGYQRLAVSGWLLGVGCQGLAVSGWLSGVGCQGLVVSGWLSGVGCQGLVCVHSFVIRENHGAATRCQVHLVTNTGPDGAVAISSANGLVGTLGTSRA